MTRQKITLYPTYVLESMCYEDLKINGQELRQNDKICLYDDPQKNLVVHVERSQTKADITLATICKRNLKSLQHSQKVQDMILAKEKQQSKYIYNFAEDF